MADANNLNKVGKWNPNFISGMIKRFVNAEDYEGALELAERSLKEAREVGDPLWINKFNEQYKKINEIILDESVLQEEKYEFDDTEDLTQITGVGKSIEAKLKKAGFNSIVQIELLISINTIIKNNGINENEILLFKRKHFSNSNKMRDTIHLKMYRLDNDISPMENS